MTENTARNSDGIIRENSKEPSLGRTSALLRAVCGGDCSAAALCRSCGCSVSVPTQETDPMCHRNRWRTVRKNNVVLNFKPDCLCWACDECRPKMRERWIQHGTRLLRECGKRIAVVTIGIESFDRFSRRLRRHNARYLRVRPDDQRYTLFVSTNDTDILNSGCEVRLLRAVELFTEMVNKITDSKGGNPISTSRAWALPSREHSDWDLIAVGPSPKAVRSAAFLVVMDCAERSIGGMQVTVCRGDTLQVDRLCELIGSLASGNPIKGKCECKEESASGAVWSMDQDVDGRRYLIGAVT